LTVDFEFALQAIRTDKKTLSDVRRRLTQAAADISEQGVHDLTDDELLVRIREPYAEFLGPALRVMASDMPYDEARTEIQRLMDELERTVKSDPVANQVLRGLMGWAKRVSGFYGLQVLSTARLNAFDTALAVYLIKGQTGHLPEALPDGLPRDPFSGEAFDYEITQEGFTLRCRVKPVDRRQVQQFEFKVYDPNAVR